MHLAIPLSNCCLLASGSSLTFATLTAIPVIAPRARTHTNSANSVRDDPHDTLPSTPPQSHIFSPRSPSPSPLRPPSPTNSLGPNDQLSDLSPSDGGESNNGDGYPLSDNVANEDAPVRPGHFSRHF